MVLNYDYNHSFKLAINHNVTVVIIKNKITLTLLMVAKPQCKTMHSTLIEELKY